MKMMDIEKTRRKKEEGWPCIWCRSVNIKRVIFKPRSIPRYNFSYPLCLCENCAKLLENGELILEEIDRKILLEKGIIV